MNSKKFITAREASKILGVHPMTLRNWAIGGKIEIIKTPGGKRLYNVSNYVNENITNEQINTNRRKICYCRVSARSQTDNLKKQIEFMKTNYPHYEIISEVGSGMNLARKKLLEIIDSAINGEIEEIVVIHKDRLARFGYELIEQIIKNKSNGKITIPLNTKLSPENEVMTDLLTTLDFFSARITGLRKFRTKIKELGKPKDN